MVSNEAEGACTERKSQSSQVASDRQFVEHLDYATSIVSRWPEWKRDVLGGVSGSSKGNRKMMSLLTWEFVSEETRWIASSQIINEFGVNPCEWCIEIDDCGYFAAETQFPSGILTAGLPLPLPSFPTLADAKEWCEKRESELRTARACGNALKSSQETEGE